jgi:hypothetical protein
MMDGPLRIYAAIVEPNDGDIGRLADDLMAFGVVVVGQGESIDVNDVFDEAPKLSLLIVDDAIGTHVGGSVIAAAKFLEADVPVLWVSSGNVTLAGFHRIAPDAVVTRPLDAATVATIASARLRAGWYSPALIESLEQSIAETFKTTFDKAIEVTDVYLKASARAKGPVHAVVPFASATSSGRLAISAEQHAFENLYRAMLPEAGDPDLDALRDVAAELLNRLYGRYKEWSAGHGVLPYCGTPTCMTHDEFLHRYRAGQPAVGIEFEAAGGTFLFEITLDHFEDVLPVPPEAEVAARPAGALLFL